MTADERIEVLVKRFGQTIDDLPRPWVDDGRTQHYAYPVEHHRSVGRTVEEWMPFKTAMTSGVFMGRYKDYICHLADVIDRMEAALETAVRVAGCPRCEHLMEMPEREGHCLDCSNGSNYQVSDGALTGFLTDARPEDMEAWYTQYNGEATYGQAEKNEADSGSDAGQV